MKIAVIGGAGQMGSWFARYFKEKGHDVLVSDIKVHKAEELARSIGAKLAESNKVAAREAEAVLVSVPIKETTKVLKEVSPFMAEGSILMEIASVKKKVHRTLKSVGSEGKFKPLSLHPLFGPGAKTMTGKRVIVVPVLDADNEMGLARRLMPEAELTQLKPEEHDRAMALVISLTHFVNVVFSSVLPDEDIAKLRRLASPIFELQLTLAEGVMHERPEVSALVLLDNPHAKGYIMEFLDKGEEIARLLAGRQKKSYEAYYSDAQRSLEARDPGFKGAYSTLYELVEGLRGKTEGSARYPSSEQTQNSTPLPMPPFKACS